MLPLRLQPVPRPDEASTDVAAGICRLERARVVGPQARRLISDAPSEFSAADDASAGSTSAGPAGFSLTHHRIPPGSRAAFSPEPNATRHTAWIVVSGEIRGLDGARLGPRSLYLAERGERIHWRLAPSSAAAGAEVLELTFVPRSGHPLPAGNRVVRAGEMAPRRSRPPFSWVPDAIGDFLSPRDLYLAMGPVAHGPLRYRVVGPEQLVVVFVQTPRGTGPALHVHTQTTEMFCVLSGRFRITWGDRGEHEAILEPLDSIVIPRGHNRAFEALDDGENWLLPMVVGTNDEREDILWLDHVFTPVRERLPMLSALASRGLIKVGQRAHPIA